LPEYLSLNLEVDKKWKIKSLTVRALAVVSAPAVTISVAVAAIAAGLRP
jgi:hypothetical protein